MPMCPVPIWSLKWCQCIISNPALDVYLCFKHVFYYFPQPSLLRFLRVNIGLKPPISWDVPSSPARLLYRSAFGRHCSVAPWPSFRLSVAISNGGRLRWIWRKGLQGMGFVAWYMGSVSKTCLEHVSSRKMDVVDPVLKLQSLDGCYQHLPAIYGHNLGMVFYHHLYLPWFPIADI